MLISYRMSHAFIDQHFRQNKKKTSDLFKELFNKTRQTFHSYIEMFSSSQTILLVLNIFYYLPINSHSTIEGKRPKGHLKFTFICDSSTEVIRIQVGMRPLSCWTKCCSGYWLFLLGRKWTLERVILKSCFSIRICNKVNALSLKDISKLSRGLRYQYWLLHEVLVLLRSTEKIPLVSMRPRFHCLSFLINNKCKFQTVSLKQPDIILHRGVLLPLIINNGNRRATEKAEVIRMWTGIGAEIANIKRLLVLFTLRDINDPQL